MIGMNALIKPKEVVIRSEVIDTRCISSVTMRVTIRCGYKNCKPVQIVDIIMMDAGELLTLRSTDQELIDQLYISLGINERYINENYINMVVFIRNNHIVHRNENIYHEVYISDYICDTEYCKKIYDEVEHKVNMERFYEMNRSLGFYKAIIVTFLNLPDNMINLLKKERLHEH